jgi:hypothetical protein
MMVIIFVNATTTNLAFGKRIKVFLEKPFIAIVRVCKYHHRYVPIKNTRLVLVYHRPTKLYFVPKTLKRALRLYAEEAFYRLTIDIVEWY